MSDSHTALQAAVRAYCARPSALPLNCGVQHFQWGTYDYVPTLMGLPSPAPEPHAELWMGAHPDLPSGLELSGYGLRLDELIELAPECVLGAGVSQRFGAELPFLFKVLSARLPLSIQAHPDKAQAQAGFRRENELGVPLDAPHRNYRDPNHKPELMLALTDFYGLRGFRPPDEIAANLRAHPELQGLAAGFEPEPGHLRQLYADWMQRPQDQVDEVLMPLIERLGAPRGIQAYLPIEPEYWLLRGHECFSVPPHADRGLLSVLLLNLVHLRPGQAMYLAAGELHAYLQGTGLELMANSNNVLRGGLTPKHVDVAELLSILSFSAGPAEIIEGVPCVGQPQMERYITPAAEFELRRLRLPAGQRHRSVDAAVRLGIVMTGSVGSASNGPSLRLERGAVFLVPAGMSLELLADGEAEVFFACVPEAG
jgi:mannose-6-phosphate isomerase class I